MTPEPIEAVIARLRVSVSPDAACIDSSVQVAIDDLSRLLDYVEGMRWRPIESAPKDQTDVLLFDPNADWWPLLARWEDEEPLQPGWYTPTVHQVFDPSHWMPLPPPPVKGGA